MTIVHYVTIWRDEGASRMWCVEGEPVDAGIVDNHFDNASSNCSKARFLWNFLQQPDDSPSPSITHHRWVGGSQKFAAQHFAVFLTQTSFQAFQENTRTIRKKHFSIIVYIIHQIGSPAHDLFCLPSAGSHPLRIFLKNPWRTSL